MYSTMRGSTVSKMRTLVVTVLISIVTTMEPCPESCHCQATVLHCHGNKAPAVIPKDTVVVYLTNFHPVAENQRPFEHECWRNISKLEITVDYPSEHLFIASKSFVGLDNLLYLGIHGISGENPLQVQKFYMEEDSLYGIENVRTLDLSRNPLLGIEHVMMILKQEYIVPKMENLILNNLYQLFSNTITLGSTFFRTLAPRPIKMLSFDETSLTIDMSSMDTSGICSTLQNISLKSTTIPVLWGSSSNRCKSLSVLDISNSSIPFLEFAMSSVFFTEDMFSAESFDARFGFLENVDKLYMNNFVKKPIRFEGGITYDASNISLNTQELQFRNNHLQWFDVSMKNIPFPAETDIDVSYNGLAYIHPRSVYPGKNIRKINLSNNKLSVMEKDHPEDYEIFLNIFSDLEDINLSFNELTEIPVNMFQGNLKLTKIDISNNKLKSFSINISNLTHLTYLDASQNHIVNFDNSQMNMINSFAANFAIRNKLQIYLRANDFKCSCLTLNFLKWVKQSTFLTEKKEKQQCEFEGELYDMKTRALDQITSICEHKALIHTSLIATGCSALGIIVVVTAVIILRRRQIRQRKINHVIKQIKQGEWTEKFLVFLSYCSEDGDFVLSHIYPQLNNHLCLITKTKRDYVCIGEKHFRPGFTIMNEVISNMEQSAIMVCVMSKAFCSKSWCQMEVKEANMQQKPILLLFKEEVDEGLMSPILRKIFQRNTRSKVVQTKGGSYEAHPSWSVLCSSIVELTAKAESNFDSSQTKEPCVSFSSLSNKAET